MQPRTDGKALPRQAVVDPALCAGCGICAGACPSSTPFRWVAELATGIDLPRAPIGALRFVLEAGLARLAARPRDAGPPGIVVFGCGAAAAGVADASTVAIELLCAAQLPPSFVEYALRAGADGVLVTGCHDGDCAFRLGHRWVRERMDGTREPHLRAVVPRDRVRASWVGRDDERALARAVAAFRVELERAEIGTPFAPPPKRVRPRE